MNFEDVGVSVSIPKQELDQGSQMEVFVHPCVTGSFILPNGYKPATSYNLLQRGNCDSAYPALCQSGE